MKLIFEYRISSADKSVALISAMSEGGPPTYMRLCDLGYVDDRHGIFVAKDTKDLLVGQYSNEQSAVLALMLRRLEC